MQMTGHLSREEVSLARESRMTLSLRWMCMQRTTFHRPVSSFLSLLHFFPCLSSRFLFFFFTFRASIELEKSSSVRCFSQRRRGKFFRHRVDRIRIFNLASSSKRFSFLWRIHVRGGGVVKKEGGACFLSTSSYDVKRPHRLTRILNDTH